MGIKLGPFAKRAGVNYQTLANVECGSQKVASFEFAVLVARALEPHTEPEELFAGDGDEETEPAGARAA